MSERKRTDPKYMDPTGYQTALDHGVPPADLFKGCVPLVGDLLFDLDCERDEVLRLRAEVESLRRLLLLYPGGGLSSYDYEAWHKERDAALAGEAKP